MVISEATMATVAGPARLLTAGPADGPTIILLHGYAATADQWRPLMLGLADRYRLLAPDLLGFGQAPKPPPPYTLERWLEQIEGLHAELGERPVLLVGHSLGGLVATELARRWGAGLAGLALLDPLGILPPLFAGVTSGPARRLIDPVRHASAAAWLFGLMRTSQGVLAGPFARSAFYRPWAVPTSAVSEWRTMISQPDAERALLDVIRRIETLTTTLQPGEITVPTLIVWGCQDRLLPVNLAAAWQMRLPEATLLLLDHCGHLPHVEQAAAVQQALVRLAQRAGLVPGHS